MFIGVWDAETGQEVCRFRAHSEMMSFLHLSPDGTQLASCGYDGLIKIWDATPAGDAPDQGTVLSATISH